MRRIHAVLALGAFALAIAPAAAAPKHTVVFGAAVAAGIFLDIAARDDPIAAHGGEALLDVDRDAIVRKRTRCVVEPNRRLAAR